MQHLQSLVARLDYRVAKTHTFEACRRMRYRLRLYWMRVMAGRLRRWMDASGLAEEPAYLPREFDRTLELDPPVGQTLDVDPER